MYGTELLQTVKHKYEKNKRESEPGYISVCFMIASNATKGSITIQPNENGEWPCTERALEYLKEDGFAITMRGVSRMSISFVAVSAIDISWE